MWRLGVMLGVAGAFAGLAVGGTASSAPVTSRHPVVGSYSLVTTITRPTRIVARGTLVIDTYNPSTGAVTGHGVAHGLPLSMTGTVRGSTITMRVVNEFGIASDRGRIHPDGTIKGTILASLRPRFGGVKQDGTWSMTPSVVAVPKVGLTVTHRGHRSTDVTWGVELRNTSNSRDAFNVTVDVRPLSKAGKVVGAYQPFLGSSVQAIPAGRTVYLGRDETLLGAVAVAKLRLTVVVDSTSAKRYVLPPVSNVRMDAARGTVTATITNPYEKSISPFDLDASLVLYDRSGRIVGGDAGGHIGDFDPGAGGLLAIKPGGQAPVWFLRAGLDRVASAHITVAPQ